MIKTILYLHGMGGGPNCGIGVGLERMTRGKTFVTEDGEECGIRVIHKLWDFDPVKGQAQIDGWVREYSPDLVMAISLGSIYALGIHGVPHIYISPAFGAGLAMQKVAEEMESSSLKSAAIRLQVPKAEEGQQKLTADPAIFKRYKALADRNENPYITGEVKPDLSYGFFGGRDWYRGLGVVTPQLWRKIMGDSPYADIAEADHNFNGYNLLPDLFRKALEFLGCKNPTGENHIFISK